MPKSSHFQAFLCYLFASAVCDDTCKEVVLDPEYELPVCRISGHCFDRLLSPCEIAEDTVCSVTSVSKLLNTFYLEHNANYICYG